MENTLGSREYFLTELLKFRQLLGQKSFWSDAKKRGLALKAIIYTWLHTNDANKNDEVHFSAVMDEYDRRLSFMTLKGEFDE